MDPDIAAYYDRLSWWTAFSRAFGYGGGRESLTVHRALTDPRADGRSTPTRLHDLLLDALPPLIGPRVLDAGCGLGGTMIDLASRVGGSYVGLTISEQQAAVGRRAAERAGFGASIEIQVRSYDTPPAGPFDLVVAIESLAHSPEPARTVRGLTDRLAPGGWIAIADDMPGEDGTASPDLETFKRGWRCPVLWSAAHHDAHLTACGLKPVCDWDLTPYFVPRTLSRIRQLERLNRAMRRAVPSGAWRAVMDSYHGGLALERLYREERMKYRLLVFQR